jgi:2-amino-4-hydroxy-6-hydroxymethyldihydropteridine diphosphokinase
MALVHLGLGSNLGDRLGMLRAALLELAALGQVAACSSVYETKPWGDPDQPAFLNLCCAFTTQLPPEELHAEIKRIERVLGRRPTRRWGPRVIDIDLLTYDDLQLETSSLTIPHVGIADRAFVLAPLAEIAPEARIPGLPGPVADLLARIPDAAELAWIVAPPPNIQPTVLPSRREAQPKPRNRD